VGFFFFLLFHPRSLDPFKVNAVPQVGHTQANTLRFIGEFRDTEILTAYSSILRKVSRSLGYSNAVNIKVLTY
jgi:hypothetical protein